MNTHLVRSSTKQGYPGPGGRQGLVGPVGPPVREDFSTEVYYCVFCLTQGEKGGRGEMGERGDAGEQVGSTYNYTL